MLYQLFVAIGSSTVHLSFRFFTASLLFRNVCFAILTFNLSCPRLELVLSFHQYNPLLFQSASQIDQSNFLILQSNSLLLQTLTVPTESYLITNFPSSPWLQRRRNQHSMPLTQLSLRSSQLVQPTQQCSNLPPSPQTLLNLHLPRHRPLQFYQHHLHPSLNQYQQA